MRFTRVGDMIEVGRDPVIIKGKNYVQVRLSQSVYSCYPSHDQYQRMDSSARAIAMLSRRTSARLLVDLYVCS